MNAIVAKLWRSEEDFETVSLLSQSLSFKTYKIYIYKSPPCLRCPGPSPRSPPPLHATAWGCFVDLHWSSSLVYTSTWNLWNWGWIAPLPHVATRLVATVFWLRATDQRRNSWLSKVHVHTNSVIQINQHNFQQSRQFSLHRKSVYQR